VRVSFDITIHGENFRVALVADLSAGQVVGKLRRLITSDSGQRQAIFVFRRGLGRSDSSISMHIKLLDATGETEEVWHAVVTLSGEVIYLHPR
jgi:hypothetical protein